MNRSSESPLPPPELRSQVAGIDDEGWFIESGRKSVDDLRRALAAVGRTLESFGHVLDFGCGCGRMARWLLDVPGLGYTGIDIDEGLISWCRANLSDTFEVGPGLPPTKLPDKPFDLIVSHSVFSHLDENYQDRWLKELQRLLQPGGLIVISFHGPTAFKTGQVQVDAATRAQWKKEMQVKGILFVRGTTWPQFPDFYHSTYHAPWYVQQRWQRWFDLLAYIPHNDLEYQDVVVMRRRFEGELALPVLGRRVTLQHALRTAEDSLTVRVRGIVDALRRGQ